ncbi:helix-turn-helix transcriptional regulator [Cupriavidus sp. 8B]|jgi:AraC family transcriptional regulator
MNLKLKQGFRSLFASSIYAYFQAERMRQARQFLRKHNVTETAMMLGYSNISHFSSAFRKQFGMLPSAVRND